MQPASHSVPATPPLHRNRHLLSALIGIVEHFSLCGVATRLDGLVAPISTHANMIGIGIVCGLPVALLLAIYGMAGVIDACAWLVRKPQPGRSAADAAMFFQLAAAFALAAGFLATTVSLVARLAQLQDPHAVGRGIAVALLNQLHGVLLAVVCLALAAHLSRKHDGPAATLTLTRRSASVAVLTAVAGVLTTLVAFCILLLSVAPGW